MKVKYMCEECGFIKIKTYKENEYVERILACTLCKDNRMIYLGVEKF